MVSQALAGYLNQENIWIIVRTIIDGAFRAYISLASMEGFLTLGLLN